MVAGHDLPLVGLVLFASGAALMPVAAFLVRSLVPERRVFFARWGFSQVGLVLLAGLATWLAVGVAGPASTAGGKLNQMFLILGVAAAVAVRAASSSEPDGWRALGLAEGRDARALVAALVAFAFVLPVMIGAQYLWPSVMRIFEAEPVAQEVLVELTELRGLALVHVLVLAVLVQPLLEELLFRGFLQPLLVQNLSDRGGVVVTSLLFALLHGSTAFFNLFVLSLVIGGVMLRTRRLSAAWLVHALNNAAAVAFAFALDGTQSS